VALILWLIDVACINIYRLYILHTGKGCLTHLQFRIELYCKLFEYSSKAKLRSLRVGLGGKRVFGPNLQYFHYWERRCRGSCIWCAYKLKCNRVLGKGGRSRPANRSIGGCAFCQVNLCKEGSGWLDYHSNNTDY
jgi:hypothetical protein